MSRGRGRGCGGGSSGLSRFGAGRGEDDGSNQIDQAGRSCQSLERRIEETSVSLIIQASGFCCRSSSVSVLDRVFGCEELGLGFEETLLMGLCATMGLEMRGKGGSRCGHGGGVLSTATMFTAVAVESSKIAKSVGMHQRL